MVSQIHTKERSLESLHVIHILLTFGPKFGPLELSKSLDIPYTNTRDPYLQVCGYQRCQNVGMACAGARLRC